MSNSALKLLPLCHFPYYYIYIERAFWFRMFKYKLNLCVFIRGSTMSTKKRCKMG